MAVGFDLAKIVNSEKEIEIMESASLLGSKTIDRRTEVLVRCWFGFMPYQPL